MPLEQEFAPAVGQVFVPQSPSGQVTSHWQDDEHDTLPHAAEPPVQVASNKPVPLVMSPQALEPVQSTVAAPEPVVIMPHAPLPEPHVRPHPPPPHMMLPHAESPVHVALPPPAPSASMLQLALPAQVSMHVPPVQLMSWHAFVVPLPSQRTVHVPAAQVMSWHASAAPHVMSHDSDAVQWMSWHAVALAQPIVQ